MRLPDSIRAFLPQPLLRRIELSTMARRTEGYGLRGPGHTLSTIEGRVDLGRIKALHQEVRSARRKDPVGAAKYTDYRFWSLLNLERAAKAGLHQGSGLRIMDIGCGAGYFIAVARALGHECWGVDLPLSHFGPVERAVYPELLRALGCQSFVSPLLVERFVPLSFPNGSYDLITAFWICFNRHKQADEWGVTEWRYFVEDALRCLRIRGRLILELNENAERYGAASYYDAATELYFRSVGTVEKNCVTVVRR